MKETAVEWLGNEMKTSKYFYKLMEDIQSRSTIAQSDILEQAKEIEKEQIENAFNYGQFDLGMEADEYYNKTFNKKL